MIHYVLQINPKPEIIKSNFFFFWCILKIDESNFSSNYGFGWANSIINAFTDANNYYVKYILNK